MIPQKLKLPMNFFLKFSLNASTVSKNAIKMIGHHARLRDATGQSYACTRANHARYSSVQVVIYLAKNLTGRNFRTYGTISWNLSKDRTI